MLENVLDQGAGLRQIARKLPQKVITLTCQGDKGIELPFLWALCASLSQLGYPLLVLDATTVETPQNPGLQECLELAYADAPCDTASSWTVLPAALGFAKLCLKNENGQAALDDLSTLFHEFGVIVIYMPTDIMLSALGQRPIEPLIASSSSEFSLLTTYQSIKKILGLTELQPRVVSVIQESAAEPKLVAASITQTLSTCTEQFLGYRIQTHALRMAGNDLLDDAEMEMLALRLLENAMPLSLGFSPVFARSH